MVIESQPFFLSCCIYFHLVRKSLRNDDDDTSSTSSLPNKNIINTYDVMLEKFGQHFPKLKEKGDKVQRVIRNENLIMILFCIN